MNIKTNNLWILSNLLQKQKFEQTASLGKIFLICEKVDRKIATIIPELRNGAKKVEISIFIEYEDPERHFTNEYIIIVEDLELKANNFGRMENFLDALKNIKEKG